MGKEMDQKVHDKEIYTDIFTNIEVIGFPVYHESTVKIYHFKAL